MNVPKPATDRPKLPSVGRLGLVHPQASAHLEQLGWNTEAHVELLWSLSRAPDADVALLAMVRLADALGAGRGRTQPPTARSTGPCGAACSVYSDPPWLSVITSSPTRSRGGCWPASVVLPGVEELHRVFTAAAREAEIDRAQAVPCPRCGTCTGTGCWSSAALDVASTVENEPVLPFVEVAAHLSDLADAALGAALTVATRVVCEDGIEPGWPSSPWANAVRASSITSATSTSSSWGSPSRTAMVTTTWRPQRGSAGEMMRFAGEAFFEVDAALRPEGKRGQLVRTLDSHVAYYQRWAKTWEFQALLKARPAAGDAGTRKGLHRGPDAHGVDRVRA